ncbi:hypothetical protein J5J10_03985 [Ciceribacter sp. L1K23]|uniref:hypothetical protein n=1 Tax=Ciceribacter sp. L1K23 TaxID=2820276 RepID=UPI001B8192F1|nr:hypothetical protein [Ciceribacter sp. L1K23]MBR0554831.1 hypothetical protein [Ciceribacter sp. L1K23]
MSDEKHFLTGLHKLAQQNGDGLIPELLDRLAAADTNLQHSAEIVKLPGLHERPNAPMSRWSPSGDAVVINFPAPRWQRNAERKNG